MPTYTYACTECDEQLEVVQSFNADPLTECPRCSGRLRKVFHPVGVVFKGSGFYRTDSRSSKASSSGTGASSTTKESSRSAGTSESSGTGGASSSGSSSGTGGASSSGSSSGSSPSSGSGAAPASSTP